MQRLFRKISHTLIGACLTIASTSVATNGNTILEHPLAAEQAGEFSNLGSSSQQIADDFVLGQSNRIQSISWFGRYLADSAIVTDSVSFSIRLFEDVAGSPAPSALLEIDVLTDALDTGLDHLTTSWLSYSINYSFPPLMPDKYWLSVAESDSRTSSSTVAQWLWADSTTSGMRAYRNSDAIPWTTELDVNHAFTIVIVPEPATALAIVCGLSLLIVHRRQSTLCKNNTHTRLEDCTTP